MTEISQIDLTPICIQIWLQKTDPDYGTIEMAPGVTLQEQIDQTHAALADYADRSRARGISQRKIDAAINAAFNIAFRRYGDLHLEIARVHEGHKRKDDGGLVSLYLGIGLDESEIKIDSDRGVMVSLAGMRKLRRLFGPTLDNPDRADAHLAAMSDVLAKPRRESCPSRQPVSS